VVQPTGATGGADISRSTHSFNADLKVGTYRVVATLDGVTRFRDFTLTGDRFAVVMAMD
jgi:hypothetical protein